jgi:hypothetical protein
MLKTLDILIGATMVLLLFSMAVTVITQAVTSIGGRRGRHLKAGLAGLLQQLGIPTKDYALKIAETVLKHPMVADGKGKLGSVIHREEFTKLLLDFASDQGAKTLDEDSKRALTEVLASNGISDPGQTLKNIRAMALKIEASNPELGNHARDGLAVLHEAGSDFVARVNSWFDQTIDRVSQRFTHYTHWITLCAAVIVVVGVQLDIIAVVDRLSIDDQFRNGVVNKAISDFSTAKLSGDATEPTVDPHPYYNLLNQTGLITLPVNRGWVQQLNDPRKIPGMLMAILLISLGAPFWYNILKDLIGLRSTLAKKDDSQRAQRQATQAGSNGAESETTAAVAAPAWLHGERGDLAAVG